MKTDQERGVYAAWLRRARLSKGWKEAEAKTRLEAAVPGVSFGTYRDLEAGNRRPNDAQRQAIEMVLGPVPNFAPEPGGSDFSALVSAVDRQTAALSRQAQATEALVALIALQNGVSPADAPTLVGDLLEELLAARGERSPGEERRMAERRRVASS